MQNIYENEKLKDYQIYSVNSKTENPITLRNEIQEVVKGAMKKYDI